eukprot:CAMPEP_0172076928 /NCGR_PEP_ID=MMETSP1043-20130122/16775_1 /TAXON_ID=464988 /ORGANISM="Hemiselmis andersenii, Strain CCMP441" /LENGTH=52 /DNA_ID=CAMNT_0012737825 /DNA_START=88 /DNA_END=242 /DNA_ORIENTATION=-
MRRGRGFMGSSVMAMLLFSVVCILAVDGARPKGKGKRGGGKEKVHLDQCGFS